MFAPGLLCSSACLGCCFVNCECLARGVQAQGESQNTPSQAFCVRTFPCPLCVQEVLLPGTPNLQVVRTVNLAERYQHPSLVGERSSSELAQPPVVYFLSLQPHQGLRVTIPPQLTLTYISSRARSRTPTHKDTTSCHACTGKREAIASLGRPDASTCGMICRMSLTLRFKF